VSKTGEIKDFIITEESGIAKGIRRIVAVTGHEAAEVRRIADGLKARLDQLEAMEGKEKDVGLKAYQVVCVAWPSHIRRHELMLAVGTQPGRHFPCLQD
jgi:alanyl-tRNA synthetase